MADALDLRSSAVRHVCSTPTPGTKMELSGSEPTDAWAVRNAAHALNPDGA